MAYFETDYFETDYFETDYFAASSTTMLASAEGICEIEDVDVADFSVVVDQVDGIFGISAVALEETPLPLTDGSEVSDATIQPRDFSVRGHTIETSNALAWAAVEKLGAHLLAAAPPANSLRQRGPLKVAFPYVHASRKFTAELVRFDVTPIENPDPRGGGLAVDTLEVEMAFRATMPHWEATSTSVVSSIGSTPVDIPMGGAPSDLLIKKPGPFTGPITFSWYDSASNLIAQLTFDVSPTGSQYLVVQTGEKRAFVNTTGLPDDATGGSVESANFTGTWIRPKANDWVYRLSQWAKLAANVGSNTEVTTTKRWPS